MQCEEGAELRALCEVLGEVAAQARIGRIAGWSDDVQPVGGAALDDEDEPAVGRGFGERHAGEAERREANGGASGGNERPAREHLHLLTNSGLTSSSASPSAGLSARAMAVRVLSLSEPGYNFSASARASTLDPARSAIRCAASTRRTR